MKDSEQSWVISSNCFSRRIFAYFSEIQEKRNRKKENGNLAKENVKKTNNVF